MAGHILIVDDVAENIQVALNILKEDNYDFSFANDGEQALDILASTDTNFDLFLLDVMMPKLDGFELCQQLKKSPQWKDVPVIFLTARIDIDSIAKGFELGGVDYITKPFQACELLARTKTHIQLYHANTFLKKKNIELKNKTKWEQLRLVTELEKNQMDMIEIMTELMEATSDETGRHIKRVAEISSLLARLHPSLNDDDANVLYHASPMHDIGKITVPYEILHKPGSYTEDEFEIMKTHTTNAYHLLNRSERSLIKSAAIIAHEHHEKWNGMGYPRQLKGDEIHIYGRIVALADVLDALTHTRCYKEAWLVDDVILYIKERRGTQFDPELVDLFMENIEKFKAIVSDR